MTDPVPPTREQIIKVVLEADVPGSGPLELVQREAEYIADKILSERVPERADDAFEADCIAADGAEPEVE